MGTVRGFFQLRLEMLQLCENDIEPVANAAAGVAMLAVRIGRNAGIV